MGERSVRRWILLTSVLTGATVALAPVAWASPVDPAAGGSAAVTPAEPGPVEPAPEDTLPVQAGPAAVAPDPTPPDPAPLDPLDAAVVVPAPTQPALDPAVIHPDTTEPTSAALDPATADPATADPATPRAVPEAGMLAGVDPDARTEAGTDAASSAACRAMTAEVHQANNPRSQASLVSSFPGEIRKAAQRLGFTDRRGVVFRAATAPGAGLEPVYRMYHPGTHDFLWILTERGRRNAVELYGYRYQQVDFYASTSPVPCAIPVYRYLKGDRHRLAASEADRRALDAAGWRSEGVKFWAATPEPAKPVPAVPAPRTGRGDSTFTIAVVPDTQYEVFGGDRFAQRNRWLVRNRDALDLEFVLHTGDVVSWDSPGHAQYEKASAALRVLDDAGVPSALAIGNHDTAAVGVGGSAARGGSTKKLVRDTTTFNRYFPPSRYSPEGVFERGKTDNTYQLFSAGGEDWMILTLELWPRHRVVEWAQDVVAAHPRHHVLVQTHSYLRSDGSISGRHHYGATSPRYLYEKLISAYPNIRMVFSGHVGQAASREDVGRHGNKVASYLGAFHSMSSNPVRLVEIDTAAGTVRTRFVSPVNGRTWPWFDTTTTGMDFD